MRLLLHQGPDFFLDREQEVTQFRTILLTILICDLLSTTDTHDPRHLEFGDESIEILGEGVYVVAQIDSVTETWRMQRTQALLYL